MRAVAETYEDLRPLLFSIAYRMLGSVTEAEDVVQESFVRYQQSLADENARIESPKAYLSAIATRLAIDHLRSARRQREHYVGEWLPEPLVTDQGALEGQRYVEEADSLSMAFLLVLERLSPVERAVFLLHEVFDYDYREIARIVGKSEDNTRQLATRARRHIQQGRTRFEASRRKRDELARRFFDLVAGHGDIEQLVELLAADVVAYGDGGGKAPAARRPLYGRERVMRLLRWLARGTRTLGLDVHHAEVNGQPGAMFFDRSGRLISVLTVDIADGLVQSLRSIINPDKLQHLGPVADIHALLRELAGHGGEGAGLP
jgi:RNA polymerase sigma-70 factor (ECF subfamily)